MGDVRGHVVKHGGDFSVSHAFDNVYFHPRGAVGDDCCRLSIGWVNRWNVVEGTRAV